MDEQLTGNESLIARILQLEHERNELRKDIEQLCMQQAGSSYLAVATRMHFQRTAGLEQEIENLKKKLAACTREMSNLQEELSEAYRIKSQLADLHAAEVSKNMEAEKQVKFFQGCVAAAFAERDHAIVEAEKAKEMEEVMSQKFNNYRMRVEELTSDFLEEKKLTAALQVDVEEQNKLNETFKKVINKFYEIRQYSLNGFCDDGSLEDKCECLLRDSPDMWDFNDQGETSTSKHVSALEEEVGTLRRSVDNLHNKLCVGLDIENHLKKRIHDLEKKRTLSEEMVNKRISGLLHYHSQHKAEVVNLLHDGYSHLKSVIDVVEEKIKQIEASRVQCLNSPRRDVMLDEKDCRDVHVNTVAGPELINKWDGPGFANSVAFASGDASEALPRALQEKVAALLLLSQQEERHLLERNVNAALRKKVDELHRNLLQVTNEKVKALMELAQLKQEYQQLQEKINEIKHGKPLAEAGEKRIDHERDGRLKNLLKKTYLKHWIGTIGFPGDQGRLNYDGNINDRMKIEHATLKESLESMEHLTATVGRLRLSLSKVVESVASDVTVAGMLQALDNILTEAKLVKTALGSSLPVSWSTEEDVRSSGASFDHEAIDGGGESGNEKVDFVTAAGFEMVEILIIASQILKDHITKGGSTDLS